MLNKNNIIQRSLMMLLISICKKNQLFKFCVQNLLNFRKCAEMQNFWLSFLNYLKLQKCVPFTRKYGKASGTKNCVYLINLSVM